MVVKLRTARIRSPSHRAREASEQGESFVSGGPRTRTCGRTQWSRSPVREAPAHLKERPRVRHIAASQAVEREMVQAALDDVLDASIDPRVVAAASGAPSLMKMFNLEDQSRAEQAVDELKQIETSAEAVENDVVSDAIPAVPHLPPTLALVHIRSEDRFNRHVYNAFVVFGATTRVAAILSREVITMKGLAKLAHGGGSYAEKWIAGVAKRLNTGESIVITPVLTQRVCNLAWYCMDWVRRGIS